MDVAVPQIGRQKGNLRKLSQRAAYDKIDELGTLGGLHWTDAGCNWRERSIFTPEIFVCIFP